MGMGPTFNCTEEVFDALPSLLQQYQIRCKEIGPMRISSPSLRLRRRLGTVDCTVYRKAKVVWIWLTCGRNPLFWWFDFRLSGEVERLLVERGAVRCESEDYFDDFP